MRGKGGRGHGQFRANQALGQHFLSDPVLLDDLVTLSGIGPEDTVFEIGPGLGSLTEALAARARAVLALEVDPRLLPILAVRLHGQHNVQVVEGDVMTANLPELLGPLGPFHVVANLPYYLTTPILNLLLTLPLPVKSINVMVQKEAAERIVAVPSTPAYAPSPTPRWPLSARRYAGARPGSFWPSNTPGTGSCRRASTRSLASHTTWRYWRRRNTPGSTSCTCTARR